MAVSLQWEPHGVVRTFTGVVPFADYMQSIAELQNDMRFDGLRYIIEDYSAVDTLQVSAADMEMVIASAIGAAYSNPFIRVAAIPHSDTTRRLIKEFARHSPYVTHLFENQDAAREWLSSVDTDSVPLDIQLQAAVDFSDHPKAL